MTVYVLSTMTSGVKYRLYKMVGDLPTPVKEILINGGANIPSMSSGFGEVSNEVETGQPMWTPSGVVTPVSDSDYAVLKDHWLFKKHLESNHVKVITRDITGNHNAVKKEVASMAPRDDFAQLTPATLKQKLGGVSVGKAENMPNDPTFRM